MWPRLLFFCSLAALPTSVSAQTADPQSLLLRVRANLLQTIERLPKYMCSLTIDRSQYQAQYSPVAVTRPSCDQLLGQQNQAKLKPRLTETDRLHLDVAIAAADEIYSWVGEARFDDRDVFHLVSDGALQTGAFAIFLSSIFGGNAANFSYQGDATIDGRKLAEFSFQVPREKSNYVYGIRHDQVIAGYEGTFLADPNTADLVRLVVRTIELPADTGACQVSTTLEYHRVRLNDADFFLPREVNLSILNTNGDEWRNRTVYSACREFRGESTLSFTEPPPTTSAQGAASQPTTFALPPGLPFKLAFTQPINAATAAAGNRIKAKLATPIRESKSKVLVPEGAEVTARILKLERFVGPPSSLRMLVKLETIVVEGTPHPLTATMNPTAPGFDKPTGLQQRMPLGSFDTLADPTTGVFEFPNAAPIFVIRSGQESAWTTVAP